MNQCDEQPRPNRGVIPPKAFDCPDTFTREQRLFGKTAWQFVGFKRDVTEPAAYLTRTVGTTPVIVQNHAGELRAFQNVCLHRGALLANKPKGKGALRCGYHGWVYDTTGSLSVLPHNASLFGFTKNELCQLKLPQYRVACCGELVFVALSNDLPSLEAWLGPLFPILERYSNAFGECLCETEVVSNANWKVLLENGLEELHSKFIHPDSFGKDDTCFDGTYDFHAWPLHSSLYNPLLPDIAEAERRKYQPYYSQPALELERYECHFAFPTLILSTHHGYLFVLHDYQPVAHNQTSTRLIAFGAKKVPGDKPTSPDYVERLEQGILHIQRQDVTAAELTQKGVGSLRTPFILGRKEERVVAFEHAYQQCFGEAIAHLPPVTASSFQREQALPPLLSV